MSVAFRHVESARTILFGPGALAEAADLIGEGYLLLSTRRAVAAAPVLVERAASMVEVPAGQVNVVAGELRAAVSGERLLALGGGRVIDVAKALAAADPPREVVAIPTSLSGAEMTGLHRHAQGVARGTSHVRPVAVVNDPALSASQPASALAASSANALGHAVTALFSVRATPLSQTVAREAAARLTSGWSAQEPDRPALALGGLLAGWAVDHTGLGPHHVLAQSAVRTASLGHAQTNAALLPATIEMIRARRPAELERLEETLGVALAEVAERLRERAGANLRALATDERLMSAAIDAAASRPELDRIPPALGREQIRDIYLTSVRPQTPQPPSANSGQRPGTPLSC
jgi:maleylacetate reductase